jgi:hypothetical protein
MQQVIHAGQFITHTELLFEDADEVPATQSTHAVILRGTGQDALLERGRLLGRELGRSARRRARRQCGAGLRTLRALRRQPRSAGESRGRKPPSKSQRP